MGNSTFIKVFNWFKIPKYFSFAHLPRCSSCCLLSSSVYLSFSYFPFFVLCFHLFTSLSFHFFLRRQNVPVCVNSDDLVFLCYTNCSIIVIKDTAIGPPEPFCWLKHHGCWKSWWQRLKLVRKTYWGKTWVKFSPKFHK